MSGEEVKIFRVEGRMLISPDHTPSWQKFVKDIRAIRREHAIEKVYSLLGSVHKLKRYHIKIDKIYEISVEETKNPTIVHILKTDKIVKR